MISGDEVARTLTLITISLEMQPKYADREQAAYETIGKSHIIANWPDEYKAEVYARLVEHAGFNGLYSDLNRAYRDALQAMQRKFSR